MELLPTPNPQPKTLKPIGNTNQKQVKRRNSCVIVKIKQSVVVRIKQLNCVIVKIKQSIPKPSLAYQSLLWHTKASFGLPTPSLAHQSLLWPTKAFFGPPKPTKAFSGLSKPLSRRTLGTSLGSSFAAPFPIFALFTHFALACTAQPRPLYLLCSHTILRTALVALILFTHHHHHPHPHDTVLYFFSASSSTMDCAVATSLALYHDSHSLEAMSLNTATALGSMTASIRLWSIPGGNEE